MLAPAAEKVENVAVKQGLEEMSLGEELGRIPPEALDEAINRLAGVSHLSVLKVMGASYVTGRALRDEFPHIHRAIDVAAERIQQVNSDMSMREIQDVSIGIEIGFTILHEIVRMQGGEPTPDP